MVGIFAGGMEATSNHYFATHWKLLLELKRLAASWGVNSFHTPYKFVLGLLGFQELVLGWANLRGLCGCLDFTLKEVCVPVASKDCHRNTVFFFLPVPNLMKGAKQMVCSCGVPFKSRLKMGKEKECNSQRLLSSGPSQLTPDLPRGETYGCYLILCFSEKLYSSPPSRPPPPRPTLLGRHGGQSDPF